MESNNPYNRITELENDLGELGRSVRVFRAIFLAGLVITDIILLASYLVK